MEIVIVGPGRIGAALAPLLSAAGDSVTLITRRETGDYTSAGFNPEAVCAALNACDALILCAGAFELHADPVRMEQCNAAAPIRIAEAVHARFPQAQIITFTDSRILRPETAVPEAIRAYWVSKKHLADRTLAVAKAWGEATGARVNSIAPGPVLPPPDKNHSEKAGTCLTPRPTIEDIYRAVRFLLDTPSVTGQILYVDAGQHLI